MLQHVEFVKEISFRNFIEHVCSIFGMSGAVVSSLGLVILLPPAYVVFILSDVGMLYVCISDKRKNTVTLMWAVFLIVSCIGLINWW